MNKVSQTKKKMSIIPCEARIFDQPIQIPQAYASDVGQATLSIKPTIDVRIRTDNFHNIRLGISQKNKKKFRI